MKINIRNSLPQIIAVMIKNLLMASFGMCVGFRTVLIGGLLQESSEGLHEVYEDELSWLGSVIVLAIVMGNLASGFVTEPIGRKRSMQFVTIPYIICWLICYFSNKIWHLYFALSVMGVFSGFVEGPFMTYVSEVAEPQLRGALATSGSMAVMLGIFFQFLLGSIYKWRTCALISCAIPTLTFCLFFFAPESPYWLLARNKLGEARKVLAWLRGWTTIDKVEIEIQEIIKHNAVISTHQPNNSSKCSQLKEYLVQFKEKSFLWPFGLISVLFVITHYTGASTLQTYAISVFATMKVPVNVYNATVFLGSVQVVGSLINVFVIRALGKRRLFFITVSAICICNTILATYALQANALYLQLSTTNDIMPHLGTTYTWIPLTFLILISLLHYSGVQALPWVLVSEVYTYKTRSVGTGVSSAMGSFISFVINKMFLYSVGTITLPGTFYLNSAVCTLSIIFVYLFIPETEGKSLESIASHFSNTSILDNRVQTQQTSLGSDNVFSEPDKRCANTKETGSKV